MAKYALNTILYGPPGTGKTFNIRKRAVDICLGTEYKKDDTPQANREYNEKYSELQREGRIRFVTFHQSYGYEEFIEGIRPVMADRKPPKASDTNEASNSVDTSNSVESSDTDGSAAGELKYEVKDGAFKASGTDGASNVGEISDADGSAAGELRYEVRDGAFKAFCRTAEKKLNETKESVPDSVPKQAETGSNVKSTIKIEKGHYVWLMNVGYQFKPYNSWTKRSDFVSVGVNDNANNKKVLREKIKAGDYIIVRKRKENENQTTDTEAIGIAQVTGKEAYESDNKKFLQRKVKWLYLAKEGDKPLNIEDSGLFPELDHNKKFWECTFSASDYGVLIRNDATTTVDYSAHQPSDNGYVFIIDEINRGNISKIFGELITLIEEDKRGIGNREPNPGEYPMSARLPYSGEDFSVPANVYILGTMNTADRSIALLDTALRRRFTFEEMMPKPEKLDGITIKGIDIKKLLNAMNRRIEVLLDREHQIGHAYFMPLKSNPDFGKLVDIFKNKIIPLLQEYFYDDYEKIKMVLNDDDDYFIKMDNEVYKRFNMKNSDFDYPEKLYSINTGEMNNEDNYIKIYSTNKQNNE